MFQFDETLFNIAEINVENGIEILNKKIELINNILTINNYDFEVDLKKICSNIISVSKNLDILYQEILDTKKIIRVFGNDSSSIFDILNDKNILGKFNEIMLLMDGRYGSSQVNAYKLLEMYFKDPDSLTDNQKQRAKLILSIFKSFKYLDSIGINDYLFILDKAKTGGCGIASNVNIIMDLYSNIERGDKLFEEKYGFPLYYEDDNKAKYYNFEALFTYLALNNIEKNLNYDWRDVVGIEHEDTQSFPNITVLVNSFFSTNGLTLDKVNQRLKEELQEEFDLEIKTVSNSNVDSYKENISNYDYCMVKSNGFTLKPYGEDSINSIGEDEIFNMEGHFMTVTGISKNNNLIVSSWGYSFELISNWWGGLSFYKVGEKSDK